MAGALDPRGAWKADRCSIAAALDVLSTRSGFLILREAFYGTTRFDDFVERVGISEPVTAAGLLEREAYREPRQRTRQLYRLTAKGADLFPALVSLMQWGDRWLDNRSGVELRHRGCGEPVGVQLTCAADHRVAPDEIELAPLLTDRADGLG
jgi:DNA-binding HxlR family transcriptional regulator